MRKFMLIFPFVACAITFHLSATSEPYSTGAWLTWIMSWVSVISFVLAAGYFLVWQFMRREQLPDTASTTFYWNEGSNKLVIPQGVSDSEANKAAAIINRGPADTGRYTKPYSTEIVFEGGKVANVVDEYYDVSAWADQYADNAKHPREKLFRDFVTEFNGPPIKKRRR